jgi:excisionase family DNA binding protein
MKLMTVKELAEMPAVKEKTLYQWAELRQIPCFKLNGALRFAHEDIKEWLSSCKRTPLCGYNPLTKLEARERRAIK